MKSTLSAVIVNRPHIFHLYYLERRKDNPPMMMRIGHTTPQCSPRRKISITAESVTKPINDERMSAMKLPCGSRRGCMTFDSRYEMGIRKKRADRKSTRLNSSHLVISYAVFCLKKKN